MNAYNAANSNFMSSQNGGDNNNGPGGGGGGGGNGNGYNMMNNLDCDGELTNLNNNNNSNTFGGDSGNMNGGGVGSNKHYSLLQNAAYGIILKDEQDLEYDSKMDPLSLNGVAAAAAGLLQNGGYAGYDVNDSMMVDLSGNVVDPLQFTATLTFSSPAEHALLDSLTDAVDLSSFLQRLPNDAMVQQTNGGSSSTGSISNGHSNNHSGNELDLSSTPSMTPDSVSITPVHEGAGCLEPFPENFIMGRGTVHNGYERFGALSNGKQYQQMENNGGSPPNYHSHHQHQQQQQQQLTGSSGRHNDSMHQMLSPQEQQQHLHQMTHNNNHNHNQQQQQQNHHQQQQQQLPPMMSYNNNSNHNGHHQHHNAPHSIDLDSHNSNMSLPSPGSSGMGSSLDGILPPPDAKPLIQSVSVKQELLSPLVSEATGSKRVLQQRVSNVCQMSTTIVHCSEH